MIRGCGRQHDIPVAFALQHNCMWASCLDWPVLYVQASGTVRLAVREMMKQAPARSNVQVSRAFFAMLAP